MEFIKSLLGNQSKILQNTPEKKLIMTDVGPNLSQVISIVQNYFPQQTIEMATQINENVMEEEPTTLALSPIDKLFELQQELDSVGATTYIQKNWTDEETAKTSYEITLYSLSEKKEQVIELYHSILGLDRRDLELKILCNISEDSPFYISTIKERAELLFNKLEELGEDVSLYIERDDDAPASLLVFTTGNMDEHTFNLEMHNLNISPLQYWEFDDITLDYPYVIDGIASNLFQMKEKIEQANGFSFIVYDENYTRDYFIRLQGNVVDKSGVKKILYNYVAETWTEAEEELNIIEYNSNGYCISGSLGDLKQMIYDLNNIQEYIYFLEIRFSDKELEEFKKEMVSNNIMVKLSKHFKLTDCLDFKSFDL